MMKKLISATLLTFALIASPTWANESQTSKVNINTANAETLDKELKYVGEKTAERIVNYRKEHGDFKNIEELSEVRGVGLQIIKANKTILTIE